MNKIILASQSPRRKQLLEWAEIDFEIIVADTDESFPENISPEEAAKHVAFHKAQAVAEKVSSNQIILAADTMVVLNNKIIGKPFSKENAVDILTELSGKKHRVITGVCILHDQQKIIFADITEVAFHELTPDQINFYVHKYKPYDKAGAYAIQEWIGVVGIKNITGDFYNVMGLPVSRVVKELQRFK